MAKRMKRHGILPKLIFGLLFSTLTACTMTQQPIGNPEAPYPDNEPAVGDIVHLPTGVKVTVEQMNAAITDAPYTPSAENVFKSAWIPAPPPESEPAIVTAIAVMLDSYTRQ